MGVPDSFDHYVHLSGGAGITLGGATGVNLGGIPNEFHLNVDKLPDTLPKIRVGLDKLEVKLDPLELKVGIALSDVPRIRTHLPAHFQIGLTVAGFELVCLKLCGEAQMIMEPYAPSAAERCSHGAVRWPTAVGVQPVAPATELGRHAKAEVSG